MTSKPLNIPKIPILYGLITLAFSLLGIMASIKLEQHLIIIPACLGIGFVTIMFYNKKFWLYSIALSSSVFFLSKSDGVSVLDVVLGVYFLFGLVIWFFWTLFVQKKKIISSLRDWLLLFFFIALIGNAVVAFVNGVNMFDWLREYAQLLLTLYYFPLKEEFEDKKDVERLLFLFSLSVLAVSFGQFYTYYKILTSDDVMYAYQLGTSVRENQTILTISIAVAVLFSFADYPKKVKIYLLGFSAISFTALIITFSRTFWAVELGLLFLVFLFLPYRKKVFFTVYAFIVLLFSVATALTFFQDNAKIFYSFIDKRMTSSTKGMKDYSLLSRLAEYDAAMEKTFPFKILSGNGLSANFHFYDPIPEMTKRTNIIHNGYIYFIFRIGVPLTLAYLAVMLLTFLKSFELSKQIKDRFYKNVALSGWLTMLTLFIVNITSSQFAYRDGIFVVAFGLALTALAEKYHTKNKSVI